MDKSFTYTISSDERTNQTLPEAGQKIFYTMNFGGFTEQYDNYICEVLSIALSVGVATAQNYLIMTCENLADNGYFCRGKIPRTDVIMGIIPLSALSDVYVQSDGGTIKFTVKNCRIPKQVVFSFLKSDFSPTIVGADLNTGGAETKWLLTLRMTPIID
jgi:hypothetical protein